VELHRVAMTRVPFFCFTEALGNDRKVPFTESVDAIRLAACVEVNCESGSPTWPPMVLKFDHNSDPSAFVSVLR
jgi:hypothetical protein